MKKLVTKTNGFLIGAWVFASQMGQKVLADDLATSDQPARLRSAQAMFAKVLTAVWALSILYFIFVIISIGARYMVSAGDENTQAILKKRGGNLVLSFILVFGGYLVVKLIISLLGFKDPGECFGGGIDTPFFQFFFPELCG